ncbi:DUF1127 domain-containing protein [Halopseudomonas sp.]|uniref:DUF1127 domain-containing protein n=1 Tax=Halopseudomonas sp. TaxID=2901191 RepID=UPI0030026DF0|tara:strand:- start:14838 stop:15092 length:255 start_codon:yes stop_codon:yes gene_type:complete
MKIASELYRGAVCRLGSGQQDNLLVKGLARVRRWRQLAYERRLLASLDGRMLRDIGVSRTEAEHESARPFWDDKGVAQRPERRS